MKELTLYDVLQVSKNASQEELTVAKNRLAKKLHPDMNVRFGIDTTKQMQEVLEAYDILSNPELRKEYDDSFFSNQNFQLFNMKEEADSVENKNSFVYCWKQAEALKRVVDESIPLMKRIKKSRKLKLLSQDALSATLTLVSFRIDPSYWNPEAMNWMLFRWLKSPYFTPAMLMSAYETHLRADLKAKERRRIRKESKIYEKQVRKLLKY